MNHKLFGTFAALIAGIVLAGCTFSLEPVNALDMDGLINGNTGLIKVTNNVDSGFSLSAVRIIQPDGSFNEYLFDDLGLTPGNSKDYRFTAGAIYLVKFHNGLGWTTDAKSATVVKGETVEVTFNGEPTTPDDLSVDKGDLTVFNEIPNGEYVIEEIRVSCGEAGRETAVYQYETEIKFDEHPTFKVPAGKYFVRARIRKNGGTVVSKWSVPALAGQADGSVSPNAEPGEITVSVDTAGAAVFNQKVLLEDGSVNTPLEEVINLLVVQGEGKITLNWTDPEDADVDHIEISYISTSMPPGSAPLTQTAGKYKETAVISGLEKGEAYAITVRTVDASGNNKSEGVQMVVVMGKDIPPGEVAWLTATVSGKRVRLSWTDPADEDFDHVEISYNSNSGFIQPLPPVAKGLQSKIIESLNYGSTYAFTVRTVDTSGNKSQGAVAIASLDKVIDDFDLDRYVTAPMAGSSPNSRSISAVQYKGTVSWRDSGNGFFTGNEFAVAVYRAVVTLTANPGYTFQGVGANSFTHTGATEIVNQANSGIVNIQFQKAIQGWYVSNIGNDTNGGGSPGDSLETVAKAVELIRTAYAVTTPPAAVWPGKADSTPVSAVIIVSGTIPLATAPSPNTNKPILISNTLNSVTGASAATPLPPIVLRGAGPDNNGIITGPSGGRILHIANGAKVIMENNLVLRGNGTGPLNSDLNGNGGGVYIAANSTFTMTGGTITGVTVTATNTGYGGAVYAAKDSTFIMKGGIITGNKAQRGAGVCIREAAFTMSGGSIEANGDTATVMAGGVYIITPTTSLEQPSSTMSGGTITGNKAIDGAGVSIENSVFTMEGGTITGNQAVIDGGGIRLMWSAKTIINDGVISDNTAGTSGGGIFVGRRGSGVTINGGSVLRNIAGQAGGGVCLSTLYPDGVPSFTMTGGTLAENQAGTYGGGVHVMDGGVFKKQPVTANGPSGVIYGYSADNPSSNLAKGTLGIETTHGHAVYLSDTMKRETTAGPDQHLDSTQDGEAGGWAD